ncbi:MAG: glycosyltransferase family 2 protein [Mycobacteriales bacterium]
MNLSVIHPPPSFVSVVVPARNATDFLAEQLDALASQDCARPWEVVVVDNASTDGGGTTKVAESFAHRFRELRVVHADDRLGAGYARNRGAALARGDFLVFCDADDVVEPGWLGALVDAAPRGDLVGGWLRTVFSDGRLPRRQRPDPVQLDTALGFLPFAPSSNMGIRREVLDALGGWSEAYVGGGEDVELSWRAQLAGWQLVFTGEAVVRHRQRARLRDLARQRYRYGLMDARVLSEHRARGASRPSTHEIAMSLAWVVGRLPYLLSREDRMVWVGVVSTRMGRVLGGLRYRTVCI